MRDSRQLGRLGRAALGMALLPGVSIAQVTTRVSVDSNSAQSDDASFFASISADGQVVSFSSVASNLVAGDKNWTTDVFVHDRATGITERVSVGPSGVEGDDFSYDSAISADGQVVAFFSYATNLVAADTNATGDVFVHDRSTGVTERISVDSAGVEGDRQSDAPSISADGRFVAFRSFASNLVGGDSEGNIDVFVHDRVTRRTERVSVDDSGRGGNRASREPAISADGQFVAFTSDSSNLVSNDLNGVSDVFVHDSSTRTTVRVSVHSTGSEGNSFSGNPSLSADGSIVAFESVSSNLVLGDTNGHVDVFVHDRTTGLTHRVSLSSSGDEAGHSSSSPSISGDGQILAFWSYASNLVSGDTAKGSDVFVHHRSTGLTERVSVDSSGEEADYFSYEAALSADGECVAFQSYASNLVAGDTNWVPDIFVHERCLLDATWSNYGAGWPGTLGIPSLTASADPVRNTTISLEVGNSTTLWCIGFLLAGLGEQSLPLRNSGTVLVDDLFLFLPIAIAPNGSSIPAKIPPESEYCGLSVFLQVLELDAGASKGVSFTPGLELVFGH